MLSSDLAAQQQQQQIQKQKQQQLQFSNLDTLSTLRTCLFYAFLLLFVPVASFFVSRSLLFAGLLRWDSGDSTLYAVGVTVVTVHAALAAYLLRVLRDSTGKVSDKHD